MKWLRKQPLPETVMQCTSLYLHYTPDSTEHPFQAQNVRVLYLSLIHIYHTFWAEGGTALIMEVSRVNDDNTDNHFLDAPARFPKIEEDEMPLHLLFSEYPDAK